VGFGAVWEAPPSNRIAKLLGQAADSVVNHDIIQHYRFTIWYRAVTGANSISCCEQQSAVGERKIKTQRVTR